MLPYGLDSAASNYARVIQPLFAGSQDHAPDPTSPDLSTWSPRHTINMVELRDYQSSSDRTLMTEGYTTTRSSTGSTGVELLTPGMHEEYNPDFPEIPPGLS